MAVIVTGGAGFVGSHLVDRLAARGERVIVIDDLSTGRLGNLAGAISRCEAIFVYADLAAPELDLGQAVREATSEPISEIYHLASPASPEAYGAHPWETLAVNSIGTMRVIDLALAHGARLLLTSTSEIYGDPLVHPQPESYFGNVNPVGPRACYDEGKRFAEAAVSVAVARRNLDGRIVRIFNCYGPRMQMGDGRLVPALFTAAAQRRPLPIHGNGQQTRSMTYVDDLVRGLMAVAATPQRALQPVNLGSEEEVSVEEVARAVAGVVGVPFELEHLPARPEDPQRRKPRIDIARSLGWEPETTLREGLRATYAWLQRDMALC
ncbi:NAD-dependent epimerase/dehydratase family protein [bacterium]|nr:MAG: NAD-dependent epimerase/dehydratase family protein [bacterium]